MSAALRMALTYGTVSIVRFKTTLYLDDVLQRGFKRLALESGRSEADLMREALHRYVAHTEPAQRPTCFASVKGPGTTARRVDELLAEGFGRH